MRRPEHATAAHGRHDRKGDERSRVQRARVKSRKGAGPSSGAPPALAAIDSSRPQALDLIKVLQAKKTLPIARAQMRVRVTMSSKEGKRMKEKIMPLVTKVEDDEWTEEWELVSINRRLLRLRIDCTLNRVPLQVALIDPGSFRVIDDLLQKEVKGPKKIETMSFAAVEDDGRIE